jgi:hypothetical protein
MTNTMKQYFSHDYNARADQKIKKLLVKHGMTGYGVYWALVEDLYNNANAMRTDYDCIAYDLRCDVNLVKTVIEDFNLFQITGNCFSSESVARRLFMRNEKSDKARESARKRWGSANGDGYEDMRTHTESDANAMRPECDSYAINKRKENKRKEKINKIDFFEELQIELNLDKRFVTIIQKWLQYKKERKQTYQKTGLTQFIKNLLKLSNNDPRIAKQIIDRSISNNWAGIFELNNKTTTTPRGNRHNESDYTPREFDREV